jgi:Rieske Fe-S protein
MSQTQPTEFSRRDAVRTAGVAGALVVGAASLSSCGEAANQVSNAASAVADAIKAADIPVGGGKVIESLKVIVTQPTAGDFKAFSAVCTHQGCTVSGVRNGEIVCPCHSSAFDIATGAVKSGPATQPLATKSVSVSADGITIS